jgi:hypothetical protein
MGFNLAPLQNVPVVVWIVLLAAAAFVGKIAVLYFQQRRSAPIALAAERRLIQAATALRDYAAGHLQRLPESLEAIGVAGSPTLVYRPVARLNLDDRLVLLHDREPTHRVLEFPVLRDGRGLVLCGGRLLVVSEEVFEKLIAADDALRERLERDEPPARPVEEDAEHGSK